MKVDALGKVGVLMGGFSGEREVSLQSGTGVLKALQAKGVNAHPFDTGERSLSELISEKFDRVFIALHGPFGEDGTIQGVLEQLEIPYTGPGVMASSIAMDKVMTKRVWSTIGIPTPRFTILTADSDWKKVVEELGLPLVVKPAHEGSTIGVTRVKKVEDLAEAYKLASQYDSLVLAEEFISGFELTCPVLEINEKAQALPLVRIVAPDGNYDFQNKYYSNKTEYLCPSGIDPKVEKEIQEITLKAFLTLGCRGWGRADIMLRQSDMKPFLLEMNTSPGMTSHSLVPMSAKAMGIDYETLCLTILQGARLDRKKVKK